MTADTARVDEVLLDQQLSSYEARQFAAVVVDAPADRAYAAVRALDPDQVARSFPPMRALGWLRALPAQLAGGRRRDVSTAEGTLPAGEANNAFVVLADDGEAEFVVGMVGKFMTPTQLEFRQITPEEFTTFAEPGYGKVALELLAPLFRHNRFPSRPFHGGSMSKVVAFTGEFVPGPQILEEADITVERLRSLLETAVIDVELDEEGDLYLTGSGVEFPIFVRLDSDRKMIQLFTYIRKIATDDATAALRLNDLNTTFALGQFHLLDDAIYSRHCVSFDGGLLPRQFVKTVRKFAGSFRESIGEMRGLLTGEDGAGLATTH